MSPRRRVPTVIWITRSRSGAGIKDAAPTPVEAGAGTGGIIDAQVEAGSSMGRKGSKLVATASSAEGTMDTHVAVGADVTGPGGEHVSGSVIGAHLELGGRLASTDNGSGPDGASTLAASGLKAAFTASPPMLRSEPWARA